MRVISLILSTALIVAPVSANAATPLQKETSVWQAFKDKKSDVFGAMFAPAYIGLYEDGLATKAKELDNLKKSNLASFKIDKFDSRTIDPDDMLMTYDVDVKGTMGKQDVSGKYHAASLWHRTGKAWLAVYHTEIKAK